MGPTVERSPAAREDARNALGIEPGELVLAHFGFLNATKGVETLLQAAARLQQSGLLFRLLFVGDEHGASDTTNAAVATQARTLARELGLESRIIRTGRLAPERISEALTAADIGVLPYTDGASFRRSALLVCLAHGLAVATTRPSSSPSLARRHLAPPFDDLGAYPIDESVALLVEPDHPEALATQISRLAADLHLRRTLARRGQALADRLTWPSVAAATLGFYRRVLSRGRS
jgi:glycosyltransferase involved in cell wall biosynthesis